MVQLNPIPVFGAKRIPVPFDRNFLPKYTYKWQVLQHCGVRHHLPLHTILSTKGFFAKRTEPTHVNSSGAECRLRNR